MALQVYNLSTYPHFVGFLECLGVDTQPSDMSFALSMDEGKLEWGSDNLDSIFAQRSNLASPSFLAMLKDVVRFGKEAPKVRRIHQLWGAAPGSSYEAHECMCCPPIHVHRYPLIPSRERCACLGPGRPDPYVPQITPAHGSVGNFPLHRNPHMNAPAPTCTWPRPPQVLDPAHTHVYRDMTLGKYLAKHNYSNAFRDNYVVPMCAAVWSVPNAQVGPGLARPGSHPRLGL